MYLRHFNFKSKPFAMNPDPAFLFRSEQHSKALTMLEYAMESQAAFCVLTGDIGSGKITDAPFQTRPVNFSRAHFCFSCKLLNPPSQKR